MKIPVPISKIPTSSKVTITTRDGLDFFTGRIGGAGIAGVPVGVAEVRFVSFVISSTSSVFQE